MPAQKTTSSPMISGSSSQLSIGRTPGRQREDRHHDQVQTEVEHREQHDRERDHQPRELDLADQHLVVDDASHRTHRRLGEEREQHDRAEQLGAVVVVAGARAACRRGRSW